MKKVVLYFIVFVLTLALAGCSASGEKTEANITSASTPLTNAPEEKHLIEETSSHDAKEPGSSASISDNIQPVEASLENPAQIGEWVEISVSNLVDDELIFHAAYCRLISVERGDAAQQAVDTYNEQHNIVKIGELGAPELEYCLLTYEVYFPDDFPKGKSGISSPERRFTLTSMDGGLVKANGSMYMMMSVTNVSDRVQASTVFPGDIWQGQSVFPMVRDFSDYLFKSTYKLNEESITCYIKGQ